MLKPEQLADLNENIRKVTDALIEGKGYAYAAGYLQAILVETIDRYVKDETDLHMIQIRLLAAGIDAKLDSVK